MDSCYKTLKDNYDHKYGGFGKHPKFPTSHTLSFLLRYHQRTGKEDSLAMVEQTLKNIRLGGIYDQVGYGIHRYSTDEKWLVPHFEKMLYDQALLTIANLECYLVTQDEFYLRSCRNTLDYVNRKLTSKQGGFYSAEDADSEGEEGKFYLWTLEELKKILGDKDASLYASKFQFRAEGNYHDEVSEKLTGKNIPHLPSNQSVFESGREMKIRKKLFAQREKRVHPQLDDKILTDWNGLMISAFSRCARGLDNSSYLKTAKKAAEEKTGARGLVTVLERTFRDFKFELPSTGIRAFDVDEETVDHPEETMSELLEQNRDQVDDSMLEDVDRFVEDFKRNHGFELRIRKPAKVALVKMAAEENRSVFAFCEKKFADFQHGLSIISQRTGKKSFVIERKAIDDPDKELSKWVVDSFGKKTGEGE